MTYRLRETRKAHTMQRFMLALWPSSVNTREATFNINVTGIFRVWRTALPVLRRSGGGSIVNVPRCTP